MHARMMHILTTVWEPLGLVELYFGWSQGTSAHAAMAPLGAHEKAAVEAFFASKRGRKTLYAAVQEQLVDYIAAKGVTLAELNTARPPDAADVSDWEWRDLATAAGITDSFDVKSVGRWIEQDEPASNGGLRTGKAFAVADALARKGVVLDRAQELAVSAALAQADQAPR